MWSITSETTDSDLADFIVNSRYGKLRKKPQIRGHVGTDDKAEFQATSATFGQT